MRGGDEVHDDDIVPVSTGPLPARLLALREAGESSFEAESNRLRISNVKEWLRPLLLDVMVCNLMDADLDTNDEFAALVDKLYDGLRNRLTRQDLLVALLDTMGQDLSAEADRIVTATRQQVRALDSQRGFMRFVQNPQS